VDAVLERLERPLGGGDVGRLRVVHVEDAAALAHLLEPVRHARELGQAARDRLRGKPRRRRGRRRRHRVLAVVAAAEPDLGCAGERARAELDPGAAPGHLEARRHDREVLRPLVAEHPQLRRAVVVEAPVPVEVVLGHVQQHADLRPELVCVLELEARRLADDRGARVERPDERAERRADVPGHRDRRVRRPPDRSEQLRRRRLPVRAGHRDEPVRQQPPGQLELADHGDAALARGRDRRRRARHARALHDAARAVDELDAVGLEVRLDPRRRLGRTRVGPDHLAVAEQHARGRRARAGEPDDQVWAGRRRGPRAGHVIEAW
jgi:hypothetical protein